MPSCGGCPGTTPCAWTTTPRCGASCASPWGSTDKLLNAVPELTIAEFTWFLRETYALPRGAAVRQLTGERARLQRAKYRRFVNENELARAAGCEAAW
jgi:hypothetical protein